MLKWLVTGRDGGEAVVDPNVSVRNVARPRTQAISINNTDDPLAAAVGYNSETNNYNLFKVNRSVLHKT